MLLLLLLLPRFSPSALLSGLLLLLLLLLLCRLGLLLLDLPVLSLFWTFSSAWSLLLLRCLSALRLRLRLLSSLLGLRLFSFLLRLRLWLRLRLLLREWEPDLRRHSNTSDHIQLHT